MILGRLDLYFGCLYWHEVPSISYINILYIAMSSTRHLVSWYPVPGTCTSGMKYQAPLTLVHSQYIRGNKYHIRCLGTRYQVPGTSYQVHTTRYLAPSTTYQVPGTLYRVPGIKYQVPCTKHQVPAARYDPKSCLPQQNRVGEPLDTSDSF